MTRLRSRGFWVTVGLVAGLEAVEYVAACCVVDALRAEEILVQADALERAGLTGRDAASDAFAISRAFSGVTAT